MGYLYDSRANAIKHPVEKNDTLSSIVEKYKGTDDVPADLDWKEIALFNWATVVEAEVTRALCERIGSDIPDAVNKGLSPVDLNLNTAFGPSTPEEILIPKLWKARGLDLNKQHTIQTKVHTPASAIGITSLDKWFIPGRESCDVAYSTVGDEAYANAVVFDVFGSNYGALSDWQDGLPKFTPLPGKPVYTADASGGVIDKWMGLSKCSEGALSPDNHPLNVAFSPYTAVLRYAMKDAHKDAYIDLKPFWLQFDEDEQLIAASCKIEWEIKNAATVQVGLLQIFDGDGAAIYAKGLNETDLESSKFEWNGKDVNNDAAVIAKMPYRVQIQAHTGIDTVDGLALAAMHTEVRLYVHPKTDLPTKPAYDPLKDKISLDLNLADVYHKDKAPERSDGSLWTKYKLAESGFHPGPVNDASVNDEFTRALNEFQRSVPKGGGQGTAPFLRMPIGPDNGDTKDALENLQPTRKRPWFGKPSDATSVPLSWRPGNWPDIKAGDFLARLRDPEKQMILWVDDRNWYTDGAYWHKGFYNTVTTVSPYNLSKVHTNPVNLGGNDGVGRGSFEHRDARVVVDERDIARPWIPLQVDFRLLSKSDTLFSDKVETPSEDVLEFMRKAIGPIRVDWTFDEIEKRATVADVKESTADVTDELPVLDPESDSLFSQLYHPASVRTGMPRPERVRTRMALRWALHKLKSVYARKDVTRTSHYYNAPEDHSGIRPNDPAGTYFKAAFGLEKESLLPWTAKPDPGRESVCTAVHDDVGQGEENLFSKRIGRAGIYLHPSRMAGDGYQVRAQARFETTGPYVFINAETLSKRYQRLPQAHTAQFRLWRKTSLRGYVQWAPTGHWGAADPSCFDTWPKVGPDEWRAQYTACCVSIENELGATDTELVGDLKKLFDPVSKYQDVIVDLLETGDTRKDPLNKHLIKLSDDFVWPWADVDDFTAQPVSGVDFNTVYAAMRSALLCVHVTIAIRMSVELADAIERTTGRMRGHILVQYQTSPACFFYQYECPSCKTIWFYAGKTAKPPTTLKPDCTCSYKLKYKGSYSSEVKRGINNVLGTPSPSCGFPGGVFWNFLGDATLWAHELSHNRHYEHSADAMQNPKDSARPEHDNAPNSLVPTNEKADNKGWDRACLLSYIAQVRDSGPRGGTPSHDKDKDVPCFCYKCVLRNRGWKIAGLPRPEGDLQDVAGI